MLADLLRLLVWLFSPTLKGTKDHCRSCQKVFMWDDTAFSDPKNGLLCRACNGDRVNVPIQFIRKGWGI